MARIDETVKNVYGHPVNWRNLDAIKNINLLKNLRYRYPQYSNHCDQILVDEYIAFAFSELWGNNDERFEEWMSEWANLGEE